MFKTPSLLLAGLVFSAAASAALPPPTPEQAAAAALAKAKAAHADQVAAYQLCQSQNKATANYAKQQAAKGKKFAPEATPACVAPSAFVPPPALAAAAPAKAAAPAAAPAKAPAAAPAAKK